MFATDRTMSRGLQSLYIPEHTHIPTSRQTPPPTGDAELADEYKHTVDPFVALAAAAAVTDRIRLGTGICLVAQRDPLVTAKAVATLDALSGGRFEFGVGFGWNRDEMEDHGVDPTTRRARSREHVLAMQALWRDEVASFDGEYVRFAPSWSWPKPTQPGGPPILVGGAAGPTLFAHVAEIPIGGAGVKEALPELHAAWEAAGRDAAGPRVVPFGTVPSADKLEYYATLGIDEVVLRVPGAGRDEVLAVLDQFAGFVDTA